MKYKFQVTENIQSGAGIIPFSTTTEFEADGLNVILLNIEVFLKKCGFQIENLDYELPSIRRINKD